MFYNLKPCPFCGGRAAMVKQEQENDVDTEAIIIRAECAKCGCQTRSYGALGEYDVPFVAEHVAALWNRRTE